MWVGHYVIVFLQIVHLRADIRPLSHWKFISKFYFEIKLSEFFFESTHVRIGNKLSKAICKQHRRRFIRRLLTVLHKWIFFHKITQNRTCSKLWNIISKFISFESWSFTLEIFLRKELIYVKFEINFEINKFPTWKLGAYESSLVQFGSVWYSLKPCFSGRSTLRAASSGELVMSPTCRRIGDSRAFSERINC